MAMLQSSSGQISFRPPLSVGDIAPDCALPALDGSIVDLRGDAIAGNPIALLFCPKFTPAVAEALAGYRSRLQVMAAAGARLFAVTLEQTKAAAGQDIPFPVLRDGKGEIFRAFNAGIRDQPTTIILRPNHHIAAIVKSPPAVQPGDALVVVERLAAERRPVLMAPHPPVLIVPEVFTHAECRRLIEIYRTRGNVFMPPGPGIDYNGEDYKMRIPEHGRPDRIDHWIV
jgi:peroxiredoxin